MYEVWCRRRRVNVRVCTHRWKWTARLEIWRHRKEPLYLKELL